MRPATLVIWLFTVGFIGPEGDQTVHTDVDDGGLANFSFVSTDGNPSTVVMEFIPVAGQVGDHIIHFTAADNFDPAGVTELDLTITVELPTANEESSWGQMKKIYK